MIFKFNVNYFLMAVLLFGVEVLIDLYLHDPVIRPFGGDFLVVMLLYCAFKSILNTRVTSTAIVTLLIAYFIETLQYFQFIYRMGWANSIIAQKVLGTTFAWGDILAYTLGVGTILFIEQARIKRSINKMYTQQIRP